MMYVSGGTLRVKVEEDGLIYVAKDVSRDDGGNSCAHLTVVDGELKWVEHPPGGHMMPLGTTNER